MLVSKHQYKIDFLFQIEWFTSINLHLENGELISESRLNHLEVLDLKNVSVANILL